MQPGEMSTETKLSQCSGWRSVYRTADSLARSRIISLAAPQICAACVAYQACAGNRVSPRSDAQRQPHWTSQQAPQLPLREPTALRQHILARAAIPSNRRPSASGCHATHAGIAQPHLRQSAAYGEPSF